MELKLSIPGKCFLVGEYLALNQGPALVFTSKPFFSFVAKRIELNQDLVAQNPFNPFSPAGRLYLAHEDFFSQFKMEWKDPRKGKGGWGASSAQFLALHYLLQLQSRFGVEGEVYVDLHELLRTYQAFAKTEGAVPSGADLVAQATGGITYFERRAGKVQRFSWPFTDLALSFVATGKKLMTHEHLGSLGVLNTERFEYSVSEAVGSMRTVNSSRFVDSLRFFSAELKNADLVAPHSLDLCERFSKVPGVLVAKGCGAMGADTILLLHNTGDLVKAGIKSLVESLGLEVVATSDDLAYGVDVQFAGQEEIVRANKASQLIEVGL